MPFRRRASARVLTFELGAFLANMPHHWDDRGEKSPQRTTCGTHMEPSARRPRAQACVASPLRPGQGGRKVRLAKAQPAGRAFRIRLLTCHHHCGLTLDSYRQEIKGDSGQEAWPSCLWGHGICRRPAFWPRNIPRGPPDMTNVDRARHPDLMIRCGSRSVLPCTRRPIWPPRKRMGFWRA